MAGHSPPGRGSPWTLDARRGLTGPTTSKTLSRRSTSVIAQARRQSNVEYTCCSSNVTDDPVHNRPPVTVCHCRRSLTLSSKGRCRAEPDVEDADGTGPAVARRLRVRRMLVLRDHKGEQAAWRREISLAGKRRYMPMVATHSLSSLQSSFNANRGARSLQCLCATICLTRSDDDRAYLAAEPVRQDVHPRRQLDGGWAGHPRESPRRQACCPSNDRQQDQDRQRRGAKTCSSRRSLHGSRMDKVLLNTRWCYAVLDRITDPRKRP
jgi:hypothetical protein